MTSNGWFKGEVQGRSELKEISALARVASRDLASPKSARTGLRRGLTGVAADDHAGQIELVRTAMGELDPTGWGTLSASDIEIKDLSGAGGSRTFRVSAPEQSSAVPQKLALHSRGENSDDFFMRRMGAAQHALAEHGLAPPRILEGKDWIIEPWEGLGNPSSETAAEWEALGVNLARMHKVPTDWWDPLKEELIRDWPELGAAPDGSLIWAYLARGKPGHLNSESWVEACTKLSGENWQRYTESIRTDHPIGRRIVTTHGDYHEGNMLVHADDSITNIDFEFTTVTHAIQDLAFGIACCGYSQDNKKAFLRGYLQELGEETSDATIESLWLEAELAQLGGWHSGGMLAMWDLAEKSEEEICDLMDIAEEFIADVRGSAKWQAKIKETRLEQCFMAYSLPKANALADALKARQYDQTGSSDKLVDEAVWHQTCSPHGQQEIGNSVELGVAGSFTALCWVKNESADLGCGDHPIFTGDFDGAAVGWNGDACKSKLLHFMVRGSKFHFGYGWNDCDSTVVSRANEWDHVAFVGSCDAQGDTQSIVVNGQKDTGRRAEPYTGNETLAIGRHAGFQSNDWVGQIQGAMFFNRALTEDEISQIANATRPQNRIVKLGIAIGSTVALLLARTHIRRG